LDKALPRIISLRFEVNPQGLMNLETKAYLISVGTVELPLPKKSDRVSTSGPGAGSQSIFFQSGEKLVRLSVVPGSKLRLEKLDDGVAIFEGDNEIARGSLVQPLSHCPEQAYITISERCIYDCKFCAVPKMMGKPKSKERILEIVDEAAATGLLKAISLTSGVETSPEAEVDRAADIVRCLRRFGVPIGVSVCATPDSNRILKEAGAAEIKYNVETLDPELFRRVCLGLNLEEILAALDDAVRVFGKNHVFTNIIVGLGESDDVLKCGIDKLTKMGVLPVLRAVYPHPLRAGEIQMTRPATERLLDLAQYTRQALNSNGLRGDKALTMCYRCTGCDLVPHRDF
jgi:biotin synthase-related radical SAM superfamily protein